MAVFSQVVGIHLATGEKLRADSWHNLRPSSHLNERRREHSGLHLGGGTISFFSCASVCFWSSFFGGNMRITHCGAEDSITSAYVCSINISLRREGTYSISLPLPVTAHHLPTGCYEALEILSSSLCYSCFSELGRLVGNKMCNQSFLGTSCELECYQVRSFCRRSAHEYPRIGRKLEILQEFDVSYVKQ
jgi:hypothetical protein